eukprot:ANDGO_04405.mRNA.1 Putative riboflavin kinase
MTESVKWQVRKIEPVVLRGAVCKGFGRGSKLLGIPTANLPIEGNETSLEALGTGIYFGWARLEDDVRLHKTVLSIGYNPHFSDVQQKTIEPHLLSSFNEDFYGKLLEVKVLGFLRNEAKFDSLEDLISAIHHDIHLATDLLDSDEYKALAHPF